MKQRKIAITGLKTDTVWPEISENFMIACTQGREHWEPGRSFQKMFVEREVRNFDFVVFNNGERFNITKR